MERLDKQYYTAPSQNTPLTEESAKDSIKILQEFNPRIITFKNSLSQEEIKKIREELKME